MCDKVSSCLLGIYRLSKLLQTGYFMRKSLVILKIMINKIPINIHVQWTQYMYMYRDTYFMIVVTVVSVNSILLNVCSIRSPDSSDPSWDRVWKYLTIRDLNNGVKKDEGSQKLEIDSRTGKKLSFFVSIYFKVLEKIKHNEQLQTLNNEDTVTYLSERCSKHSALAHNTIIHDIPSSFKLAPKFYNKENTTINHTDIAQNISIQSLNSW